MVKGAILKIGMGRVAWTVVMPAYCYIHVGVDAKQVKLLFVYYVKALWGDECERGYYALSVLCGERGKNY